MNRWRKFAALPWSDRRLLWEAALLLLWARIELAVLPFARVVAISKCPANRLLKKAYSRPLPDGRGSVSYCKYGDNLRHRARKQAVFGVFQQPVSAAASGAVDQIPRVGWAVETTARLSPWTLACLPQALAAWWMLRSRGYSARLMYGVSNDVKTGFSAHAWVEVDGMAVVGGRAARGFTVLTSFPE